MVIATFIKILISAIHKCLVGFGPKGLTSREFHPKGNNLKIAFPGCQWQQPLPECPLEHPRG